MSLILGAKGLDEQPICAASDLQQLYKIADDTLKTGTPLSVPIGVPLGTFAITAATLRAYEQFLREVLAFKRSGVHAPATTIAEIDAESLQTLAAKAEKLLGIQPAPPRPTLVIPK